MFFLFEPVSLPYQQICLPVFVFLNYKNAIYVSGINFIFNSTVLDVLLLMFVFTRSSFFSICFLRRLLLWTIYTTPQKSRNTNVLRVFCKSNSDELSFYSIEFHFSQVLSKKTAAYY